MFMFLFLFDICKMYSTQMWIFYKTFSCLEFLS